jgi:hypothetical protein
MASMCVDPSLCVSANFGECRTEKSPNCDGTNRSGWWLVFRLLVITLYSQLSISANTCWSATNAPSVAPAPPRELLHDLVAQSDDAVWVFPGRSQAGRDVPMAWRHEWNAVTDEHGNDVDVELVDLAGVGKRGDESTATRHPKCVFRARRADAMQII